MQNRLVLCYTTLFINFHCQKHGDNEVSSSTVNLAFRRLQPKITEIQKIQQGTNNEGQHDSFHLLHIVHFLQKGGGGNKT